MNLGHVSVVSIIGMIISMLIAIGLPVFLMLFVRKKEKAQINFFFIGAAVCFVVVTLVYKLLLSPMLVKMYLCWQHCS